MQSSSRFSPKLSSSQSRLDEFLLPSLSSASTSAVISDSNMQLASRLPSYIQRVYVLCGVVGSGKSTLAVQFEALCPSRFTRVNQDSLGSRKKCEDLARASIEKGKSVLVDRQNFDAPQRYTWLEIGHSSGIEVVALVFQTSKKACADRLKKRRNHETVKSVEQGLQILHSMSAIFSQPTPSEGFHRIVHLPVSLPLRYTPADVNALLNLTDDSPSLHGTLPPPPDSTARRNFMPRSGWRERTVVQPVVPSGGSSNLMNHWLGRPTGVRNSLRSDRGSGTETEPPRFPIQATNRSQVRLTPYPPPSAEMFERSSR
ncbi:MAG: hypothetical protein CYPHOPRED_001146 [Cyphobasidiales sp. Tagirdzhanova-0007]|nr:MAG: hypothetical protein CYPHOPRED_001146 [Cyphobasidiales sp. Tagirdzhanova-0007]